MLITDLEKESSKKSMKSFHRTMLDRRTEEHELAMHIEAFDNDKKDQETPDAEMPDNPTELKAGLNMVKPKLPSTAAQLSSRGGSRESRHYNSNSRKRRSDETSKILKQYETRESKSKTQLEAKKEKLLAAAMASKGGDALAKARERFLGRKKQVEKDARGSS